MLFAWLTITIQSANLLTNLAIFISLSIVLCLMVLLVIAHHQVAYRRACRTLLSMVYILAHKDKFVSETERAATEHTQVEADVRK